MTFHERWMSDEQAQHIANLAASVKGKGSIVEIGCWEGFSTHYIANAVYPEDVFCIDTWAGNVDEHAEHVSVVAATQRDIFQSFQENMDTLTQGNYIVYRTNSKTIHLHGTEQIAFLHIDASHDYTSVTQDITLWYPFIVSGGIMCGDDYKTASADRADLQGGVEKAVQDFFTPRGITVHLLHNAWWIYKP